MSLKKNIFNYIGTISLIAVIVFVTNCKKESHDHSGHKDQLGTQANILPEPGKKIFIHKDYSFEYHFDKKPAVGMLIVIVKVFDANDKQIRSIKITGNSGMPAMRGAHDSGSQAFKLNKKSDYLLPVNIVMPGEWEVNLTFVKDKKIIFKGTIRFNV